MSRIGMKPISVPTSVQVNISPEKVEVKGPKGVLETRIPFQIQVEVKDGRIIISRNSEDKQTKSFHGLTRALINNTVVGVTEGFKKQLKIIGVGYRAEVKGKNLEMQLGFSHPVIFPIPEDITISVEPKENLITVEGIDRQRVGEISAVVRRFRKPDAYKGKGIRYLDERISLKAGKTGA
ncbi:MAG: 50S ribosomal protein L6 [Acidobacteria bacterium CG_4_9_14_3_um_filter_49_7]|nr:MAG: 50S ribosomal protein L6 [Acidobacteria bacterium CG_4_9_14_3_um_filter_49_7]